MAADRGGWEKLVADGGWEGLVADRDRWEGLVADTSGWEGLVADRGGREGLVADGSGQEGLVADGGGREGLVADGSGWEGLVADGGDPSQNTSKKIKQKCSLVLLTVSLFPKSHFLGTSHKEISFELRGHNRVQIDQLNPLFHIFADLVNRGSVADH